MNKEDKEEKASNPMDQATPIVLEVPKEKDQMIDL